MQLMQYIYTMFILIKYVELYVVQSTFVLFKAVFPPSLSLPFSSRWIYWLNFKRLIIQFSEGTTTVFHQNHGIFTFAFFRGCNGEVIRFLLIFHGKSLSKSAGRKFLHQKKKKKRKLLVDKVHFKWFFSDNWTGNSRRQKKIVALVKARRTMFG